MLRRGSGIKVEATAGDGLTISTYIKDAGNPPFGRGLPGLIYHQRAQSNEFLLRPVTGTSFLAIVCCRSTRRGSSLWTNQPCEYVKLRERWGKAPRDRLSGAGLKPLQAAAVKSRGGERWNKSVGENLCR